MDSRWAMRRGRFGQPVYYHYCLERSSTVGSEARCADALIQAAGVLGGTRIDRRIHPPVLQQAEMAKQSAPPARMVAAGRNVPV